MRPAERGPSLRQAVALGLLQGPAELLPISSSAHTTLVPWLRAAGRRGSTRSRRKSLEVALHGGAGAALAIGCGRALRARGLARSALAARRRSRSPRRRRRSPASRCGVGSSGGSVARARSLPGSRPGPRRWRWPTRARARRSLAADDGPRDGLALGLAQALALAPGVSRNGATLAAARCARLRPLGGRSRCRGCPGCRCCAGASVLELARAAKARAPGQRGGDARRRRAGSVRLDAAAPACWLRSDAGAHCSRTRSTAALLATLVLVRLRRAQ